MDSMDITIPRLKVLGARVIVQEEKQDDTTKGGIIIPGKEKQPTFRGYVVAVGEGAMLDDGTIVPMRVKLRDKIVYNNWTGSPILSEGITYIILNERDILAILD